jgi:hypothetical protein
MALRGMYTKSDGILFATNLLNDIEHFCERINLVTIHHLSNNILKAPKIVRFSAPKE